MKVQNLKDMLIYMERYSIVAILRLIKYIYIA